MIVKYSIVRNVLNLMQIWECREKNDWRGIKEINCTICGKALQNREKISDNRKLEHWMFKKSKFRFFPNCIYEDECFF